MKKLFSAILFVLLFVCVFSFNYVRAQEVEETNIQEVENQDENEATEEDATKPETEGDGTTTSGTDNSVNTENPVAQTNTEPNTGSDNIVTEPTTTESNLPVQKAIVRIIKVDKETQEPLAGARLQVIDSEGNIYEWVSTDKPYELMLPNGEYTLREIEAPEGYEIAEDQTFTVEIVIDVGYHANTVNPNVPCEAATTYYVEIDGKKHEVYCINQYLTEPGPDAEYNGKILTPDDVRNYTQQITLKDPYTNNDDNYNAIHQQYPGYVLYHHGHLTDGPIDVSDQSLSNQELYDILLNIVYRRTLAGNMDRFKNIPVEAISYITEAALKTYTNAGVTQLQREFNLLPGEEAIYEQVGNAYWYLMHMYRDYVYDPTVPYGWRVEIGHGDALGNFARHWAQDKPLHGNRNLSVDHPEYAELFYFLLGDETSSSLVHPDDMHIYIYKALNTLEGDDGFQNLLGITGYIEDFEPPVVNVVMENEYSNEKREISVTKVWDDKDDYLKIRPKSVTIDLYANNVKVDSIELNESNGWTYTFENLDKYQNGKLIQYTVREVGISGYFVEISGDMDKGFVVTNINYGTGGDNPETADGIVVYMVLTIISLLGVIRYTNLYVKNL